MVERHFPCHGLSWSFQPLAERFQIFWKRQRTFSGVSLLNRDFPPGAEETFRLSGLCRVVLYSSVLYRVLYSSAGWQQDA